MGPDASGLAALALGGDDAPEASAEGDMEGDYRDAVEGMSGQLISAVQDGDPAAVADTLQSIFDAMSSRPSPMDEGA